MSDSDHNKTRSAPFGEQKFDFLGTKGSIFQQDSIKVGIDLSRSGETVTIFGTNLRQSIEKPKGGPPLKPGLISAKQLPARDTPSERKPYPQRKGSLSPGPAPTTRCSSKSRSNEAQRRHQPYPPRRETRERERSWSLPGELPLSARPWDVKKVEFHYTNKLVPLIFSSHPRYSKDFEALRRKFKIDVDIQENCDHLSVQLKGHRKGISKAENELHDLVKHVQESITTELVTPIIPCALFPTLVTQQMLSTVAEIEKKNRVRILVRKANNSQLSLDSEEITQPFSSPGSLPKVVDFRDFIVPFQPVRTNYRWQFENNSGEFEPVTGEVQEYMNDRYYSGLPQFSYNGKHYDIDFVGEKIHEIETGVVHKLRKEPVPPAWYHYVGSQLGYVNFEPRDSEALESLLLYGGSGVKVLHIQNATVDFENMALVNLRSLFTEPLITICRFPNLDTASRVPTYGIKLAIEGLEDDIRFSQLALREELEGINLTEEKVHLTDVPLERQHKIRAQVINNARQYFVDLSVTEDNGQVIVVIKGEQKYVQNVNLQLKKGEIELQRWFLTQDRHFASAKSSRYPEEWKPQTNSCELQDVAVGSVEWNGVLSHMRVTLPQVKLLKVERIQNKDLWEKYALRMERMKEKNGDSGVNEKLLFHGTRGTDPKEIVESDMGIDFRYSSQDRNLLWGKGAYFAVNASYSDNYSHQRARDKQILLVRVLTGRSYSYGKCKDTSLTKPPPLVPGGPVLYDTVNGYTNGSEVYVVYDHERAYPAYVITYNY